MDALELHRRALVWDNHVCVSIEDDSRWESELGRCIAAGVDAVTLNVGDSVTPLEAQLRLIARLRAFIQAHPERYVLISTVADIRRAQAEGRLAIAFDVEGVYAMGEQLSLLQLYYDLGVRWMLFVYNARNLAGSGCHDEHDAGLTPFGRRVVEEMDRIGMLKCCSHTGYRTALDILECSTRPSIFSHSNALALCAHPRNIPNELIDACAARGGVIGLNGVGIFLREDNAADVDLLVRHVDHVVQRVGAAHVGLGLDYVFDQVMLDRLLGELKQVWPERLGYRPGIRFIAPEALPEFTEHLLRRGYGEADVRGILGENLLRVAAAVWK